MTRSFVARWWRSGKAQIAILVVAALASIFVWNRWAPASDPAASAAPPPLLASVSESIAPRPPVDATRSAPKPARPGAVAPAPRAHSLYPDGIAPFIERVAPQARRGDADAAWSVYLAEALCAPSERLRKASRDFEKSNPDLAAKVQRRLAETDRLCVGITPAQVEERFGFLEQAVRAGNRDAIIQYWSDPPTGVDRDKPDMRDPRVVAWASLAIDSLQMMAGEGDGRAWARLALEYRSGALVPRDLRTAVMYEAAIQAWFERSDADLDPLHGKGLEPRTAGLDPEDARIAIARGRALAERFAEKNP